MDELASCGEIIERLSREKTLLEVENKRLEQENEQLKRELEEGK